MRRLIARATAIEEINFLLTNRIPRRLATRIVGRLSRIERPWVAQPAIRLWRLFCDVDLADAQERHFASMHACFTRRLRPGARVFRPGDATIASPSDAIVGASGIVREGVACQIKGAPYRIEELLGSTEEATALEGGSFVTLRLTAGMYHRFHAPDDLIVERVRYLSGDCWNVNTAALRRVERLFCRNERAVIHCRLADGTPLVLVAVAAILVASIRLTFLDTPGLLRAGGPRTVALAAALACGDEMGWFEHGSTIVMLAPPGTTLAEGRANGQRLQAGDPLLARAPGLDQPPKP